MRTAIFKWNRWTYVGNRILSEMLSPFLSGTIYYMCSCCYNAFAGADLARSQPLW